MALCLYLFGISLILAGALTAAQVTHINPDGCIAPDHPTTFPYCNLLADSLYGDCASATPISALLSCYCRPEVLSAVYGCENEQELCQGNTNENIIYQSIGSAFHSACDNYTSFDFTTPSILSLVNTINPSICNSVELACYSGRQFDSSCSEKFATNAQSFGNCLCAPRVMSLAYTCEYLGRLYCGSSTDPPANISNVQGWGTCLGYEKILTTNIPPLTGPPANIPASTTPVSAAVAPASSSSASGGSRSTTPLTGMTGMSTSNSNTRVTSPHSTSTSTLGIMSVSGITVSVSTSTRSAGASRQISGMGVGMGVVGVVALQVVWLYIFVFGFVFGR